MVKQIDQAVIQGMVQYIKQPVLFVRNVLHAKPDLWQAEALQALSESNRVVVRSGHGVGKTTFEAWAALWFLFTRPFPKVPCTAPTMGQLFDILWPEIAKWLEQAPALKQLFEWQKTRVINIQHPERWFATAKTANKPENMAGYHEDHLLFVVDEGSGVSDKIYETIEGALTRPDCKLLICGNPTRTSGEFHDAFFKNRSLYWVRKVPCSESRLVDPAYRERLVKKYGEDSDVVRVRADGEFPKAEPDVFISLELAEAAAMREVEPETDTELEIGVDVARFGDDETVIAARLTRKLAQMRCYTKQDTMQTVGQIIAVAKELMQKHAKPRCTVKIDDDGVGGGVTDRLREVIREQPGLYITVIPCHNGGAASDPEHYENWGTEAWAHFRDLLQAGTVEIINDEDLIGQLSTRKYRVTSKGKIALESKKEMKARNLRSPDRADAVVLAFAETGAAIDPAAVGLLRGVKIYG